MKIIYFPYFRSIMTYGVIFWGNSTDRNNVFKRQKRAIRLITNSSNRTSCRGLFKELDILPLHSQYILSLAIFVVKNMEIFIPNSDIHTNNTRSKSNLFLPLTRLTKCQKGVYFAGIKIFNYLRENIKKVSDNTNLKVNLRNSFHWAPFILLKNSMDGHPKEIFMLHIFNQHFPTILYVFYYKVSTPSIVSFGCGDIIHIDILVQEGFDIVNIFTPMICLHYKLIRS